MQHCHRKTNKNKIWKWINTNKVYTVEELVHTDLTWRQDLWKKEDNEIKTEMQSQLQPIIHKIASDKSTKIMYKKFGRWVTKQTRNISTMGKIIKINRKTATVKKYKKIKRKWIETNEVVEWRKNKIKEIKITLNNSNHIKAVEIISSPKRDKEQSTEHTENANTQQPEKVPVGMWNLWTGPEANEYILQNANSTTTLHIASDGTVRDSQKRGNWSWFAFLKKENGNCEKNGI